MRTGKQNVIFIVLSGNHRENEKQKIHWIVWLYIPSHVTQIILLCYMVSIKYDLYINELSGDCQQLHPAWYKLVGNSNFKDSYRWLAQYSFQRFRCTIYGSECIAFESTKLYEYLWIVHYNKHKSGLLVNFHNRQNNQNN